MDVETDRREHSRPLDNWWIPRESVWSYKSSFVLHENIMRFAKYSDALTKEARFKDKRSKIGIRWDGTERVVLKGKDMTDLRERVFERDKWTCVDSEYGDRCKGPLELSHWPPKSKSEGSDVDSQVSCRCQKHHRLLDGHGCDLHF